MVVSSAQEVAVVLNQVISGQPFGVFYGTYYARDNQGNLLKTAQGLLQPERGNQTYCSCRDN
jgi:hypothetical protein